jgi:signal transduction histidine kinase/ligand-binding sensor domain-containing protein
MPFLEGSDLSTSNIWSHISSISEDSEGRLWIAAVYSGLNVYDPTSGDLWHFEGSEGTGMLHSSFVWETFESDDGTIWVSTGGEGREVYKIKEEPFTIPFFEFNELRDSLSTVRGILKDATGSIWIAHSPFSPNEPLLRSSLWKIDPTLSDIRKIRIEPDAPSASLSNFMGSISLDATGNIWAGTTEGYFIGDTRQEDFKKFIPDIDFPEGTWWIPPILKSSRGAIWIPYLGRGVIRYEPESDTYEVFEHDPDILGSLSGATVWGIYEDRAGNIWVGGGSFTPSTDTPIFMDRYNPDSKSFEPYISTIMPYGIVSDIVEDELGNLWFIDWNSGLYKLNPGTREIKRLTSSNSLLPGSGISSLLKHPDGMLWLATERELIEFDPINETLSIYDERHGVVPAGGFSESGFLTEDGSLLFARYEGFHAFRPDTLLTGLNSRLPDLRITGFQLLDDNLYSGSSSSYEVLDAPIWETEHIQLERSQNTFAFSIACFDFYEPDRNTLQFMLEGYDRGWRGDLRNGETPFFVNVPPGKYTFKIRGSNGLGVWDTEGVQMTIEILPPWWQRWWALVLFALIVVVTGFGFHKWQRQRVLIKERKRAQAKELEQAREIEKAYHQLKETQQQLIHSEKMASLGELTAGIAHEIQNPLNFVNNFSEVSSELIEEMTQEMDKGELEEVRAIAKDLRQNLDKITHHGQRADSIVKGMLQHSRNHDGKKEPTDLNKLADEYLRLAYHGLRAKDKTFNAATETDFDPDLPKIQVVPQDMGRVLLNLLTNAFHAVNEKKTDNVPDYKPKVTITSRMTEKGVAISVSDNGNGIPDSIRDKIFQPFFTTKATGEGTGLGLSMSYDIVKKAHGGELNLNSEEGQGTTFTVFLPLSDPPNPNLN